MSAHPEFDRSAYLERLGLDRELRHARPSLETLRRLHEAHLAHIPFENLDVFLGLPVSLDLGSLQDKLVRRRRGGYCFEQNALFAATLSAFGFEVATLEARVRPPGAVSVLPRTHMVLRVLAGGAAWLADVGFGGDGPLQPVPLDGVKSEEPGTTYRVVREPTGTHVLQRSWRGAWTDLYAFTLAPALPVDYEVAHHYTATHPASIFVQKLTVQRSTAEARYVLRGTTYTVRRAEDEETREVPRAELVELLRGTFGLALPDEVVSSLERRLDSGFGSGSEDVTRKRES